jgi:hypothetical protein
MAIKTRLIYEFDGGEPYNTPEEADHTRGGPSRIDLQFRVLRQGPPPHTALFPSFIDSLIPTYQNILPAGDDHPLQTWAMHQYLPRADKRRRHLPLLKNMIQSLRRNFTGKSGEL